MTAHTPGPWTLCRAWNGRYFIVGPSKTANTTDEERICNCPGGASTDAKIKARGLANARLMTAAPVMLAELRTVLATGGRLAVGDLARVRDIVDHLDAEP